MAKLTDDDSDKGSGGKSGEIAFRYKETGGGPLRDDMLAPAELKRLRIVHQDIHKQRVDKQKLTRAERAANKLGRPLASSYQKGLGGSAGSSRYKKHPISDNAQFSGADKQVVGLPTLNEADTNAELKDALENRLENKFRNKPKFNPRPQFPG